jgi:hypothetical protein
VNTCFAVPLHKQSRDQPSQNHNYGAQTPSKLTPTVVRATGSHSRLIHPTRIRIKAFTATELDKILSDNKPCQLWRKTQRFGDHIRVHHQGNDIIRFHKGQ